MRPQCKEVTVNNSFSNRPPVGRGPTWEPLVRAVQRTARCRHIREGETASLLRKPSRWIDAF